MIELLQKLSCLHLWSNRVRPVISCWRFFDQDQLVFNWISFLFFPANFIHISGTTSRHLAKSGGFLMKLRGLIDIKVSQVKFSWEKLITHQILVTLVKYILKYLLKNWMAVDLVHHCGLKKQLRQILFVTDSTNYLRA